VDRTIGGPDLEAPTAASLNGPLDLAVDDHGNLFIADSLDNRILEYDRP